MFVVESWIIKLAGTMEIETKRNMPSGALNSGFKGLFCATRGVDTICARVILRSVLVGSVLSPCQVQH